MTGLRHCGDLIQVTTPEGKVEKVPAHRPDIALLLARGHVPASPKTRPVAPLNPTPRQAAALARARQAVAAADLVVARAPSNPMGMPLTAKQRAAVNRMPNVVVLETVGSVLGRELALRDKRLNAMEGAIREIAEATRTDILARARRACLRVVA
ncbi:hypothetical protein QTI24_01450 [Variovorax sp. J22P240]|uniref:hypothetical protein n=1 Tax=Variovorax sp. J22P240 TaxID=3053514 RepID=UPI0025774302|nr:hypothetical protein [Variovorax sp. J22P240]MDL9997247.1 hypothetical protein [Variovorax sp. J22P240]